LLSKDTSTIKEVKMESRQAVQELKEKIKDPLVNEEEFMGEITLEVRKDKLKEVLSFLKQVPGPGYEVLMDLTGVDYLDPIPRTKVLYWLHNPVDYSRIRVIIFVERDGSLPSVTDLWKGSNWYERELYDLFGVKFDQHPDMKRILMPDDWVGHPLRKDYPLTEVSVEFKHGVRPKVPSQIIPWTKRNKPFGLNN
jgi:NADH-quinone oxidoreductase subunit C